MGMYDGLICPVCNKSFKESDDVVVCPVCGTPHHRECWKNVGNCINADKHESGFQWQRPKSAFNGDGAGNAVQNEAEGIVCPQCGRKNPQNSRFCSACGFSFEENGSTFNQKTAAPFGSFKSFGVNPPYNPYFNVSSDETIGDETVSDVATFVGVNSERYIPVFMRMEKKKDKASWNWCAFLFSYLWFFFRKNYLAGAISLIVNLTLNVVFYNSIMTAYNLLQQNPGVVPANLDMHPVTLYLILYFAINVVWGLIGDYLYKSNVISKIRKYKSIASDEYAYQSLLQQKGGVSGMSILVSYIGSKAALNILIMLIKALSKIL